MEEIRWTGQECQAKFPDCHNFRDLIAAFEEMCIGQDRVLCRVQVDGLPLSEEEEKKFSDVVVSEIKEIVFETGTVIQVVEDSLVSLGRLAPKLFEETLLLSEIFRVGDKRSADRLLHLLDGLQYIIDTLSQVGAVGSVRGYSWQKSQEWMEADGHSTAAIKELLAAYGKRDDLLVADVLEYELTASIKQWQSVIEAIQIKK